MKLGINAVDLYPGKIGGAEQYLRNILDQFVKYEDTDIYLFVNTYAYDTFEESGNLTVIQLDPSYDSAIQLQGYIDYYRFDVWFCPLLHLVPENCGIPNATTIFDIQPYFYPQYFDRQVLNTRKKLTEATARKTDKILTVSEYSKQTIIQKLGYPGEKIAVTNLDSDRSFYLSCDEAVAREIKKRLPDKYILFPANMWPHKNHMNLLRAYVIVKNKYNLDLKLVFTGAREKETDNITKFISENGLREDITYLGYIPQDEMRYVYHFASMLAFPTRFEGFPLPVVEAMRMDVPIVCSNSTCLPEMAKNAALMFNPESPDEIAEAIYRVSTDEALRKQLLKNAEELRAEYSWEKCASQTMEELKKLCQEKKPEEMPCAGEKSKEMPCSGKKPEEMPCSGKKPEEMPFREKPLVSIVTPSYNQGEFIRDTIESVLSQSYENIEYIVMDGGSTDNTVEILKSYGDRIKWVSQKDGGQSDAINRGIARARGTIIGWLNSDDTYYPGAVEAMVETFRTHPGLGMAYGEGYYINREGKETSRFNTRIYDYREFAKECTICQPAAFFTKELFERVGGLRADLHLCMDYELWMRIGKESKPLYVPRKIATSRMYEENKTMSFPGETFLEVFKVLKEHYGYVPESWLCGYIHYINYVKKEERKHLMLSLLLKYNLGKPSLVLSILKPRIKARLQAYLPKKETAPVPRNIRYSDGWISEEYSEDVRLMGFESDILIKGRNLLFNDEGLVLTVSLEGLQHTYPIDKPGDFSLCIPVSEKRKTAKITISANKIRRPSLQDPRELSVIIDQIIPVNSHAPKPLVTVITPSYNQGKYIRRTIESVLNQDYENVEYIVVDGGSKDNTLDILKEYEGRLKYISEPDKGQSDAINKGFRMAEGEIIAWLNSDDVYEPGAISKAVNVLGNSDAALAYGKGYIIDENDNRVKPFEYIRKFNLWALVNVCDFILQPATFFRKDAFNAVGGLDEGLNWAMDWDLWIKLALKYNVSYIEDFLACSREYGETKTSTGGEARLEEIRALMEKYSGNAKPFGYELCKIAERIKHSESDAQYRELLARLSYMVRVQPAADTLDYSSSECNFYIKPEDKITAVRFEVEHKELMGVSMWLDGVCVYSSRIGTGVHDIAIKPGETAISTLHIELDSDRIKSIGNQSESGLKITLISQTSD